MEIIPGPFLKTIDSEVKWKMAEGNPHQDNKLELDIPQNLIDLIKNAKGGDNNLPTEDKG